MQRIIVSVTNDFSTDQRVKKFCEFLSNQDFEVTLIGRKSQNNLSSTNNYKTVRMQLFFIKGFLFYAEFNTRLFFKLLTLKSDILLANDLDTLLPNFIVHKLTKRKLVYDSHELFTEVPELTSRPIIRNIWLAIEKFIFPKLKNVITVNKKIAKFYQNKYEIPVNIVRNIAPELVNKIADSNLTKKIKNNKKMLILQGTGINIDRGAEEAVIMMQYIENAVLYIIGSGDVFHNLKNIIRDYGLESKVFTMDKMPYEELLEYTKIADLGLSLDKGTNLNYEYSLPNKIFDYIQCQTPIITSNREVVSELVTKHNIGTVVNTHDPKELALIVNSILFDEKLNDTWKENLKKTAEIYSWENEIDQLKKIFNNLQ